MINKSCYFCSSRDNKAYCIINKSVIEDCDNNCNYFGMVSASPVFLSHVDQLYTNASKSEKVEGFDNFAMHSNALYFINKTADGHESIVTVEEMAKIIELFYEGNIPDLRLLSCRAGALDSDDGVAQKLANLLNIRVLAARGVVNIYRDGDVTVTDPITGEESKDESLWKIFSPNNDKEDNI